METIGGAAGAAFEIGGELYAAEKDLHSHTRYSHGRGTIEDNVKAAIARGLGVIGITEHGPGHFGFGVPRRKLAEMKAEIIRLRREYPEIEILFGVEANILAPDGRLDIKPDEYDYFDFICAGWHFGAVDGMTPSGIANTFENLARNNVSTATNRQMRRNTDMYVCAVQSGVIKFLTHPGEKAPVFMREVAKACAKNGTLLEINTSHMSLTPQTIKSIIDLDVGFIINSDAHAPRRIGDFGAGIELIIETGLDPGRVANLKRL